MGIGANVEGVVASFELIAAESVSVSVIEVEGSEVIWGDGDLNGRILTSAKKRGLLVADKDFVGLFDATDGVWGFGVDFDNVLSWDVAGVLDLDLDIEGSFGQGSAFKSALVEELVLEGGV